MTPCAWAVSLEKSRYNNDNEKNETSILCWCFLFSFKILCNKMFDSKDPDQSALKSAD